MKKRILTIVLAVTALVLLVACGETTTKPTISGASDKTIQLNEAFDPKAGVTAKDSEGNDLTDQIQIEGTVNVAEAAVYTLKYSVEDASGNKASVDRKITVQDGSNPDPELTKAEREKQLVHAFVAFLGTSQGKATIQENGGIVSISQTDPSWADVKADYPAAYLDNSDITLKFGGSTSVEKIARALSAQFAGLAGNFIAEHGHTGSGDAFKRTQGSEKDGANALHIAFASRVFSASELEGSAAGTYGVLAQDAVVAVVNTANTLTNITAEQLKGIYDHSIENWSALELPEAEIASYTRDTSSGTREAFFEAIGLPKSHGEAALGSTTVDSNGAMMTSVAGNPAGIGYISLSGLATSGLKGLNFNGVEPTEENVLDNSYQLKRLFNYIIRDYN